MARIVLPNPNVPFISTVKEKDGSLRKIDSVWYQPLKSIVDAANNGTGGGPVAIGDVTGLSAALALKANIASPSLTGTPTAPTPSLGDNTTKIATTAFVMANAGGGGGGTAITTPLTLSVPSVFATIDLALAEVDALVLTDACTSITINVDAGSISRSTPLTIQKSYGDRLQIIGAATSTIAISAIGTVTGAAGAYSVVLSVASTTGVNIGDIVGVEATTGAADNQVHRGAWVVTAFVLNTSVTVTNTAFNLAPPTGVTGLLRLYPTQIKFTGASGIIGGSINLLQNVAIKGDNTLGSIGVRATTFNGMHGKINLDQVAVNGFNADGIRANYNGIVTCSTTWASNNGNNGYLTRDGGMLYGSAVFSSGNGYAAPAGGGNGYLCENNSSMLLFAPQSYGNSGDGLFCRSASSILVDASAPAFIVGCTNGLRSSYSGFLQATGCAVTNSAGSGILAEHQGNILATGSGITTSAVNAATATDLGFIEAAGLTISGTTAAGIFASGQSRVLANGSALSGIGTTAYIAADLAWIDSTGGTGTTSRSPAVNTFGSNNAYVKG